MTTIAATLEMMAADSKVDLGDTNFYTEKIFRINGAIVGSAGDDEACHRFFQWWTEGRSRPLRIPKRFDFQGLALTPEGLWYFESATANLVKEGAMAIGTGRELAIAAMDTMRLLKRRVDPRVAVRVACKRDDTTGGPVTFLRLKR